MSHVYEMGFVFLPASFSIARGPKKSGAPPGGPERTFWVPE